jgi:hypothetical protein
MNPGVRTQRSVVDRIAQRGFDHIQRVDKKRKEINSRPKRVCSTEDCSVILSKYNDTDFCALHERENALLNKFI